MDDEQPAEMPDNRAGGQAGAGELRGLGVASEHSQADRPAWRAADLPR